MLYAGPGAEWMRNYHIDYDLIRLSANLAYSVVRHLIQRNYHIFLLCQKVLWISLMCVVLPPLLFPSSSEHHVLMPDGIRFIKEFN